MSGRYALLLAVWGVTGCAAAAPSVAAATLPTATGEVVPVQISLAHDTPREEATRAQLTRLTVTHDLRPWLFTRRVIIDEEAIPHSHPVLTLHARHLEDDDQLLSTFVHEEIHWFLEAREATTAAAVIELRALFPGLPVGFPDGAQSEQSSYEHLIVIYLERVGLSGLVGEDRASETFRFWESDHYRALYRVVRENRDAVGGIVRRNDLLPATVRAETAAKGAKILQGQSPP